MNVDLLRTMCSTYGPTGRETSIVQVLQNTLADCGFSVNVDALGNVIARRGEGASDVFVTHIDQRSWVVEHKDKEGFLQLKSIPLDSRLGSGWASDESQDLFYVSLNDEGKAFLAESLLDGKGMVGDFLVPRAEFQSTDKKVLAGALSDRTGVTILLEAAAGLKKTKKPVAFVFYVGKHLGFMGLTSSLVSLNIERLFVLETLEKNTTSSNGSVLLPVRTQRSIPSSKTLGVVSKLAEEEGIDILKIIDTEHQSAADALARTGIESLVLGIPLRNCGSRVENLKTADYDALLKLVWRLEK